MCSRWCTRGLSVQLCSSLPRAPALSTMELSWTKRSSRLSLSSGTWTGTCIHTHPHIHTHMNMHTDTTNNTHIHITHISILYTHPTYAHTHAYTHCMHLHTFHTHINIPIMQKRIHTHAHTHASQVYIPHKPHSFMHNTHTINTHITHTHHNLTHIIDNSIHTHCMHSIHWLTLHTPQSYAHHTQSHTDTHNILLTTHVPHSPSTPHLEDGHALWMRYRPWVSLLLLFLNCPCVLSLQQSSLGLYLSVPVISLLDFMPFQGRSHCVFWSVPRISGDV